MGKILSYENKNFSIMGDSISTLWGCNPSGYEVFYRWEECEAANVFSSADTWWGKVIEALGGYLLVNNSFSGSMVCKDIFCDFESYGCSDERTGNLGTYEENPDVIMILLGLNDFGGGMKLMPNEVGNDLSVFSVAYDTMLKKIKRNYPEAEIWCMTLPYGYESKNPSERKPLVRRGHHLSEYCDIIRQCAAENACKLLDIFHPEAPYDTIDGYHPNLDGMNTIASDVLSEIERLEKGNDH